jgi:hypothetical protein
MHMYEVSGTYMMAISPDYNRVEYFLLPNDVFIAVTVS